MPFEYMRWIVNGVICIEEHCDPVRLGLPPDSDVALIGNSCIYWNHQWIVDGIDECHAISL